MSYDLRPTVTTWGEHTSRFLEPDALDTFMEWLAAQAQTLLETEPRAVGVDYWFANGTKVLDYLAACDPATAVLPDEIEDEITAARLLLGNMRRLVPAWRTCLRRDGSLNLFSD